MKIQSQIKKETGKIIPEQKRIILGGKRPKSGIFIQFLLSFYLRFCQGAGGDWFSHRLVEKFRFSYVFPAVVSSKMENAQIKKQKRTKLASSQEYSFEQLLLPASLPALNDGNMIYDRMERFMLPVEGVCVCLCAFSSSSSRKNELSKDVRMCGWQKGKRGFSLGKVGGRWKG